MYYVRQDDEERMRLFQGLEMEDIAAMPFSAKRQWLEQQLNRRRVPWEEGHIDILVARHTILTDSFNLVSALTQQDLRKDFKFVFDGETVGSQDAGGMGREWFTALTAQLFDPQLALFQFTETNHGCYQVPMNPTPTI